jgi:hypothetical protein
MTLGFGCLNVGYSLVLTGMVGSHTFPVGYRMRCVCLRFQCVWQGQGLFGPGELPNQAQRIDD